MVIEFLQQNAFASLFVISLIATLISTLITKWLTDQEHLRNLKKRQKDLQNELKKCSGNECKIKEIQAEMLEITGIMMKSSFKPVLVTMIPFLILFYWLRNIYTPVFGNYWIIYYLIFGIISGIIFRKLFKMA